MLDDCSRWTASTEKAFDAGWSVGGRGRINEELERDRPRGIAAGGLLVRGGGGVRDNEKTRFLIIKIYLRKQWILSIKADMWKVERG